MFHNNTNINVQYVGHRSFIIVLINDIAYCIVTPLVVLLNSSSAIRKRVKEVFYNLFKWMNLMKESDTVTDLYTMSD